MRHARFAPSSRVLRATRFQQTSPITTYSASQQGLTGIAAVRKAAALEVCPAVDDTPGDRLFEVGTDFA